MSANLTKSPFYLDEQQVKWVADTIASMTENEKVEQLFCPLSYSNDPGYLTNVLGAYKLGGVMLRSNPAKEVQAAINTLQANASIPLIISANLEDGGCGIANEGTYMGRQMLMAATGEPEQARRLGRICGVEGEAVGVNVTYAPIVDVDMNFMNPITNVRTYGSNPDTVLNMGQAYIDGLTGTGVVPTIKHFPGDGVDARDQHLLTSVNSLSLQDWEATFGKVYRGLIEAGAPIVMAGHIAMPAMEEFYDGKACTRVIPGSISANVLRYLREELGFNGLITTDASPMVGMMAVTNRREAVPLAIENGCDMYLFTKDLEEDMKFMKEGVANGLLSQKRLHEALERILALKAMMGLPQKKENGTLLRKEEQLSVLANPEHMAWAVECADKGVTLVKDVRGILPISPENHRRVLLEILGDFPSNDRVYEHFAHRLTEAGFEVTKYIPESFETIFLDGTVEGFKGKYDLVFYIGNIENASNKTTARINWHTLFGAGNNLPWFAKEIPTVFVSVGNPYHLYDVPMVPAYVNAYCHAPAVIDAAIDKVLGKSKFKGSNPIDPFCGCWDTRL